MIRNGKCRRGVAFAICTNPFHFPKNGRDGLKLVSKMALKKWNTNFRLESSVRKCRPTFSDVPLLRQIFLPERPKKSCTMILYFPNGFSGNIFQTVSSYYLKVSLGTIHKVFNVSISQRSYLSMTSTREQRLF